MNREELTEKTKNILLDFLVNHPRYVKVVIDLYDFCAYDADGFNYGYSSFIYGSQTQTEFVNLIDEVENLMGELEIEDNLDGWSVEVTKEGFAGFNENP